MLTPSFTRPTVRSQWSPRRFIQPWSICMGDRWHCALSGKRKAGGHDADHRVGLAIQLDRFVQNAAIAAKVTLPNLITQHRNVVLARLLLAGQKGAPQQRLHAEDLKKLSVPCTLSSHRTAPGVSIGHFVEVSIGGQCC
jgi:hypothetical protein